MESTNSDLEFLIIFELEKTTNRECQFEQGEQKQQNFMQEEDYKVGDNRKCVFQTAR